MNSHNRLPHIRNSFIPEFTLNEPLNHKDFKNSVFKYSPKGDPFQYLTNSERKAPKLRPVCPSRNFNSYSSIHSPSYSISSSPRPSENIYTSPSAPLLSNQLHIPNSSDSKPEHKKEIYSENTLSKVNLRIRRLTSNTPREVISYKEIEKPVIEHGVDLRRDSKRLGTPSFRITEGDILKDSTDLVAETPHKKRVKYPMKVDGLFDRRSIVRRSTGRYLLKPQTCINKKTGMNGHKSEQVYDERSFGEI